MNKHTPGPWERKGKYGGTIGHWEDASTSPDGTLKHWREIVHMPGLLLETELANARLIAAAPELLKALRNLLAYANAYSDSMMAHGRGAEQLGNGADAVSVSGMARAAIAKATGEPY